jgi:hypothetical protein
MQQVYLKKMTKQDITRSVAVCTESVECFWGLSSQNTTEYMPIRICSENNLDYFPNDIEIHKGYNGEKDWRITGSFKDLYRDSNAQEGDIMCVKKMKRFFILSIIKNNTEAYKILSLFFVGKDNYVILNVEEKSDASLQAENTYSSQSNLSLLTAMRTKPFLLLAGISGTGKSRIVKKMAFESCPNIVGLREDSTSPGNYKLIEVKPNWHDSSELLGYESQINGAHYVVTPFIQFLVKAMKYKQVPFFVCMDEMNLAPVEQYFAEFLSVLESRTLEKGEITSEPLISASIFKKYEETLKKEIFGRKVEEANMNSPYANATQDAPIGYTCSDEEEIYELLKEKGLRIPSNLIVIGTVNMDETTHQFSRKVIDRAMTIEMNIKDSDEPFEEFFKGESELRYLETPIAFKEFKPSVVSASKALEELEENKVDVDIIKKQVPTLLNELNKALNGTPFKIAYRVQNELVVYIYNLYLQYKTKSIEDLIPIAIDDILMLKVLPRIEGDEDMLELPLKELANFVSPYEKSKKKVEEMQERLTRAHFTSFWP